MRIEQKKIVSPVYGFLLFSQFPVVNKFCSQVTIRGRGKVSTAMEIEHNAEMVFPHKRNAWKIFFFVDYSSLLAAKTVAFTIRIDRVIFLTILAVTELTVATFRSMLSPWNLAISNSFSIRIDAKIDVRSSVTCCLTLRTRIFNITWCLVKVLQDIASKWILRNNFSPLECNKSQKFCKFVSSIERRFY